MSEPTLHRRKFLVLAGAATAAGLAGCTTSQPTAQSQAGDSESTATTSPETEPAEGGDDHAEEDEHTEENGEHGHDEAVGDPVDVGEVSMASTSTSEHFEPHVVRVTKGGAVHWTNESGTHSTTAYSPANDKPQLMPDGASAWDSGTLTEAGATFEHTFETEGVYHYYCTPHESIGMIGSVIVGEPDAHGQPALEEPPEDMPEPVREKITELNAMCNEALGHTH